MAECCKKPMSHLGFFVALLVVVAVGGGAYLYFNSTVLTPVQEQVQTAQQNPGLSHPPKDKMPSKTEKPEPAPSASAAPTGTK